MRHGDNCEAHDLPFDSCSYCKDEEIAGLRAEIEILTRQKGVLTQALTQIESLGEEFGHPCGPRVFNAYGTIAHDALNVVRADEALMAQAVQQKEEGEG